MADAITKARTQYFRDKHSEKLRVLVTYELDMDLSWGLDKIKEELRTYGELWSIERKLGEKKVKIQFLDFVEHNTNLAFSMRRAGSRYVDVCDQVEDYYNLSPGDRIMIDLYDQECGFLGGQLLAEVVGKKPYLVYIISGGHKDTVWELHSPNVSVMARAYNDHRIIRDHCPACLYRQELEERERRERNSCKERKEK